MMNIDSIVSSITPENRVQKEKELKEVCSEFEGMFLQKMMQTMRQASMESDLVKKSNGEKIFTDMLDQEYVNLAAKTGNNGLGETLFNHLKQTLPEFKQSGNNFPPAEQEGKKGYNINELKMKALNINIAY